MRRRDGEELPADVTPCKDFAMSERFRAWAVSQMQGDVKAQISASGLDRMAMLKRKGTDAGPAPAKV